MKALTEEQFVIMEMRMILEFLKSLKEWEGEPHFIEDYAEEVGGITLHKEWRDLMLAQGREVSKERMIWKTLPDKDKELDIKLCQRVLQHFISKLEVQLEMLIKSKLIEIKQDKSDG